MNNEEDCGYANGAEDGMFKPFFTVLYVEAGELFADGCACAWSEGDGDSCEGKEGTEADICE